MSGLAYDTGMRISELLNLLIADADLERRQVHIRESKCKKDRYVTISSHSVRGTKKHLAINSPELYLFDHSERKGIPISKTRVRGILKEAPEKAGIQKDVCVHTFRHTFATHQLDALQKCRTEYMGGHIEACEDCGEIRSALNSCRNRHCPKCGATDKEKWVLAREADLPPP
jgi:integrase